MSKRKSIKHSQIPQKQQNKAGLAPQAPKVGSNEHNQYR
jgi:hypothetical protein